MRLVAPVTAALAAMAAPASSQEPERPWAAQVTPYLWAAGLGGDVSPRDGFPPLEVSESFGDILESLDAAFFVTGFARSGRVVLFGDLSYVATSKGAPAPAFARPVDRVEGEVDQLSATLAAGWRAVDADRFAVDTLAGGRLWRISTEARGEVSGTTVVRAADVTAFLDPIVGLRGRADLTDRVSATAYADVGGFGLGSDLTWQVAATLNYAATDRLWVSVGWRHLSVDYDSDGVVFDVELSGPLLGATLTF